MLALVPLSTEPTSPTTTNPPADALRPSVAVLPLVPLEAQEGARAETLTAILVEGLRDSRSFAQVLGPLEVDCRLGGLTARQSLLATLLDPNTLVDATLLGPLGVGRVLYGTLDRSDPQGHQVTLRLVDASTGRMVTTGIAVPRAQPGVLVDGAWDLLAQTDLTRPPAPPAPATTEEEPSSASPMRLGAVVGAGVAVALGVAALLATGALGEGAVLWTMGLRDRHFVAAIPSPGLGGTPRFALLWTPAATMAAGAVASSVVALVGVAAAVALGGVAWLSG
ncbi:MAG: hypothetical protein AB2A00_13640 [Myxococcota bacterium]